MGASTSVSSSRLVPWYRSAAGAASSIASVGSGPLRGNHGRRMAGSTIGCLSVGQQGVRIGGINRKDGWHMGADGAMKGMGEQGGG